MQAAWAHAQDAPAHRMTIAIAHTQDAETVVVSTIITIATATKNQKESVLFKKHAFFVDCYKNFCYTNIRTSKEKKYEKRLYKGYSQIT